jgi:hypothetical protein
MRVPKRFRSAAGLGFASLGLVAGVAGLAVLACDGSTWLSLHDVASFREVELDEARRIAARPDARVVQTVSRRGGRAVPGAEIVLPEAGWPPQVTDEGPVVILAGDAQDGYRLAARLARSGIQDIAVYTGDIEAWREPRSEESDEVAAARREEE